MSDLVDATVVKVGRVVWRPDDDDEMRGAAIIGRAVVAVDGVFKIDALLVASVHPRTLGKRYAVFFDSTGRVVALDIDTPSEAPCVS